MPEPDFRIMKSFPKNLFGIVDCSKTKNMKNQIFEFGATWWPKNEFENSKWLFYIDYFLWLIDNGLWNF